MSKQKEEIMANIAAGIFEYEKDVVAMTNEELQDHCFADGDWFEHDFCVQEWLRRGKKLPSKRPHV